MLETILTIVHVIGSLVLITIILLQSGKGQGVAAGLGGASGAAKKMFGGGRTQSALGKATIAIGSLYLLTSISLAFLSSQPDSAMDLQQGDENFGARQGTVIEVGGDGEEGGSEASADDSTGSSSEQPAGDDSAGSDEPSDGDGAVPSTGGEPSGSTGSTGAESIDSPDDSAASDDSAAPGDEPAADSPSESGASDD